jgi:hypothetical protein
VGSRLGADLHAFGIKLGVAFGYTCPGERAHQPAGRTAHDRPCRRTDGGSY